MTMIDDKTELTDFDITKRQALHVLRAYAVELFTSCDGKIVWEDRPNGFGLLPQVTYNPYGSYGEFLGASNHEAALERLKAIDDRTHTIHFSGFGGTDYVLVPLTEDIAQECIEIANALASYPVLDEEDLSRREYEAVDSAIADELKYSHEEAELTEAETAAVYEYVHESGEATYSEGYVTDETVAEAVQHVLAEREKAKLPRQDETLF